MARRGTRGAWLRSPGALRWRAMTTKACPSCATVNDKSLSHCGGCGRAMRFELSPRVQQLIVAAIVTAFVSYMVWDTKKMGDHVRDIPVRSASAPH